MTTSRLWFVRRGGQQRGPFPAALIERNIALGRILADDELSHDGEAWCHASTYPDFETIKNPATGLRRHDERQRDRRLVPTVSAACEERRAEERRRPEDPDEVARRAQAFSVWQGLTSARTPARLLTLFAPAMAVVLFGVAWYFDPSTEPHETVCVAAPSPGVRWSDCDFQARALSGLDLTNAQISGAKLGRADLAGSKLVGARLRYTDLAAANLRGTDLRRADLTGANLREADLSDADLRGADLRFADLTGAKLVEAALASATLGDALWTTGDICLRKSVGTCLITPAR